MKPDFDEETKLLEKLRRIEALFAGAKTPGERDAAGAARERILERLARTTPLDPPIDYRFSIADSWERKLFYALLRRYGLRPFRIRGQRRTTVRVKLPRSFLDETLWPEYIELVETLRTHLSAVTDRIIHEAFHSDSSEPAEEPGAKPETEREPERSVPHGHQGPGQPGPAPAPPHAGHVDPPGAARMREQAKESTPPHGGPKVGRNAPCPCGSGKKFKRCCGP